MYFHRLVLGIALVLPELKIKLSVFSNPEISCTRLSEK